MTRCHTPVSVRDEAIVLSSHATGRRLLKEGYAWDMAAPIFEVGDDQPTPLECEDRDGRTVVRLRRDTRVTPCLVQAINDILLGEDDGIDTSVDDISPPA